ncbi:MAG: serine hydrolase domain-containing protein [Candidatus Acidiferrum sp.]|jgi:CubicO group peptidase (beta-lactamase class C family)
MLSLNRRLFASLAFLVFAVSARSQELSKEKQSEISQVVSNFMAAHSIPGLAVAVVLDGRPAFSAGFGMADLENFVPATSATLFRLGSVSKPITATAVLQLYERGKLDLDVPIQKYCPVFPQKDQPITTRELLNHLSGIRHYNPDGKGDIAEDSARHFSSMEEALSIFASDPLVAPPGTKFRYSTYGYTVLGCVLEGASGQKYTDFVRENVLRPAAMEHTEVDNSFAIVPHRSRWYNKNRAGAVENAGVLDSSYKIPGGGWLSSGDDLARYESAILANTLLKPATRDLMWSPGHTAAGEQLSYGLGWGSETRFGLKLYGHTGGQQGTSTVITLVPERRAGVVVLANLEHADVYSLSMQLLAIILSLKDLPAAKTP